MSLSDQETGDGAEQLRGLGDVAQLEVRDLTGERDVALAVEEAAEMADRRRFIDLWPQVRRAAHRADVT